MAVTATQDIPKDVVSRLRLYSTIGWNRPGYRFKEWNTKPDGTGVSYSDGAEVIFSSDVTLYAIWEELLEDGLLLESDTDGTNFLELESSEGILELEN